MRDIDEMLAKHERTQPDLLAHAGVVEAGARPEPAPRPPRSTWPRSLARKHWRPSDRAELAYWVRKLYGEQAQSAVATARTLSLDRKVIQDEIDKQGIKRTSISTEERRAMVRRAAGDAPTTPTKVADDLGLPLTTVIADFHALGLATSRDRQAQVFAQAKALYEERHGNVTGPEIARLLDIKVTSAQSILARIRRQSARPTTTDPKVERTVGRALTQMADMAELLLTQPLAALAPSSEVADLWEQQIRAIVRTVNSVRRHAKGESHDHQ